MTRKNALLILYLGATFALVEVGAEILAKTLLAPLPAPVVVLARVLQGAGLLAAIGAFLYLRRPLSQHETSGHESSDSLVSAHHVFQAYFRDVTRHLALSGILIMILGLFSLLLYLHVLAPLPGGTYSGLVMTAALAAITLAWWQPFQSFRREAARLQNATGDR